MPRWLNVTNKRQPQPMIPVDYADNCGTTDLAPMRYCVRDRSAVLQILAASRLIKRNSCGTRDLAFMITTELRTCRRRNVDKKPGLGRQRRGGRKLPSGG